MQQHLVTIYKKYVHCKKVPGFRPASGLHSQQHHQHKLVGVVGVASDVALTILERSQPRFAGDTLPDSQPGCLLAVADHIDSLVGLFAAGCAPTATADPYGLRRNANALLQVGICIISQRAPVDHFWHACLKVVIIDRDTPNRKSIQVIITCALKFECYFLSVSCPLCSHSNDISQMGITAIIMLSLLLMVTGGKASSQAYLSNWSNAWVLNHHGIVWLSCMQTCVASHADLGSMVNAEGHDQGAPEHLITKRMCRYC